MNVVNAISKARFGTAKPQRIQLHKGRELLAELLCLEAGQKFSASGECTYYVVTGNASLTGEGDSAELPTGHLAAFSPGEGHSMSNSGEGRLVLLAIGRLDQ